MLDGNPESSADPFTLPVSSLLSCEMHMVAYQVSNPITIMGHVTEEVEERNRKGEERRRRKKKRKRRKKEEEGGKELMEQKDRWTFPAIR